MRITLATALLLSAITILCAAADETPSVVCRLLPSKNGYERAEIKTGVTIWKKVKEFSGLGSISIKEKTLTVFRRRDDGNVQETTKRRPGDGAVIFTVARGMHGHIYMAVAVERKPSENGENDKSFKVLGVEVLKHAEVAGANVAQESFLGRFRGRGNDGISAGGSKSDAVSGATISSRAVVEGIKKSLAIAQLLFDAPAEK